MRRMRPLLGTFVEINVTDTLARPQIIAAMDNAFAAIQDIQQQLSFHDPQSALSQLNNAPLQWHRFTPAGIRCLTLARRITRVTAGKFNCTIGRRVVDTGALPAPRNAAVDTVAQGSWEDIEISGCMARLRRPLWITLDGIAKGFAVDLAIDALKTGGIQSAWINAGGDIRVFGDLTMPIGICDHHRNAHYMGGLQNAAIATSTGEGTAHQPGILLAPSGDRIPNATWSVIATRAWKADALTKVAANVPLPERHEFLQRLGGTWIPIDYPNPQNLAPNNPRSGTGICIR